MGFIIKNVIIERNVIIEYFILFKFFFKIFLFMVSIRSRISFMLRTCSANKLTSPIVKILYDHLWYDVKSSWTYPSLHSSLKDTVLGGQSEKTLQLGWPDSSPTMVVGG